MWRREIAGFLQIYQNADGLAEVLLSLLLAASKFVLTAGADSVTSTAPEASSTPTCTFRTYRPWVSGLEECDDVINVAQVSMHGTAASADNGFDTSKPKIYKIKVATCKRESVFT